MLNWLLVTKLKLLLYFYKGSTTNHRGKNSEINSIHDLLLNIGSRRQYGHFAGIY